MKPELKRFSVTPSVVLADCETEIYVQALDGWMLFFDDIDYEVQFIPSDENDVPMDSSMTLRGMEFNRKTFKVRPKNGVMKLKHYFKGEQQWNIRIRAINYRKHEPYTHTIVGSSFDWVLARPKKWSTVSIYSLKSDLYNRRVLRGDLHIHTNITDGDESPALTAVEYRQAGYDFAVITDHYFYDIGRIAREKFDFKTDFQLPVGEEIHNVFDGHLHIINIGSSKSINEMFQNERERIEEEVMALGKTAIIPEGIDKREYLYRLWVYLEVKKYGGLVIFPHPYWNIDRVRWHVGPALSIAILKNKLCDAFEILGGGNAEENNMQTALYYEVQREGISLPVVASTDNHTVLLNKGHFANASTYVFAEDNDISKAILDMYSVAVEHLSDETSTRFYGPYRLVRYARFLADYYFPLHNELCASVGPVLRSYVQGEKELKPLLEALEARVTDYEHKFFGRKH